MTEEDAREVVRTLTDAAGYRRLEQLSDLVVNENRVQNLIAASTESVLWSRHVLDSVQLLRLASDMAGCWMDIGTGGGFPGLAVAAADADRPVMLVEPRRLRAEFLRRAAAELCLSNVTVRQSKVENLRDVVAAVVSARAVARVEKLLQAARHCATSRTRWLLLSGRTPVDGDAMFHVEQSMSDPAASIIVFDGLPA